MMREAEKFLGQLNRTVVYEGLHKTLDTNDVGEMNKELPRLNSAVVIDRLTETETETSVNRSIFG